MSHQHVGEVKETLIEAAKNSEAKDSELDLSFVPWRGDFTRGIFVSTFVRTALSFVQVQKMYQTYYDAHPFVYVSDEPIDLKSVINTNRVLIELHQDDQQLVVHVALDNLLKGASGQAVQNFNLMHGLPETQGLKLKGVAF